MHRPSRLLILLLSLLLPWSAVAGALAPQCLFAAAAPAAMPTAMADHCPHARDSRHDAVAATVDGDRVDVVDLPHRACQCPDACTAANGVPASPLHAVIAPAATLILASPSAEMPRDAVPRRLLRPPAPISA